MGLANRELQLRKTAQLYAYILTVQKKEVPEAVYDDEYPSDYMTQLVQEIQGLDGDTLQKIIYTQSQEAQGLAEWWAMYQLYTPVDDSFK
ncbi:hypothetical protein JHD48_06225 [Sulfurimonas sp. SAG-AH-194-I05]|nr:hypothetical protein [Sulfurimonas sp. SAG-AH-194-I05]MDF1875324.1 hypothetical protein [Sulfurimonas sp. SAG-AH-194-I05]